MATRIGDDAPMIPAFSAVVCLSPRYHTVVLATVVWRHATWGQGAGRPPDVGLAPSVQER